MGLESLIAAYGLPAIFLGCAVEGETMAFIGGIFAHRALLPYPEAALAAALGAFAADQAVFFAGRHARGHPKVVAALARPAAARVLAWLARRPTAFILGFRFVPGLRIAGPLTMGAAGVPYRLFLPLNALSAGVWGALYVGLGYHSGRVIEALAGHRPLLEHLALALGAALALAAALAWTRRRR
jgi:membrane protein DedA with SNARE-associated domain